MKFAIPLMLLASIFSAHADSIKSRIHSIDIAPKKGQSHLIMLENGSVVFLKYNEQRELKAFQESLKNDELLQVEVDAKNNFISAETVGDNAPENEEPRNEPSFTYDPTVVSSGTATTRIFRRMRRDYQNDSQCYNRAHVWAWEEFQNSGLKSMKHFLFFTRRYIRNYNYKWWFHVSPSVVVKGLGIRILDRRYTGGYRTVSSWTRNFVYSRRACPVVNKYYDYRNNQEKEDCYLIPVSMYFWQPRDIERRDRTGFEKTSFIQSEVDYAYWEAF